MMQCGRCRSSFYLAAQQPDSFARFLTEIVDDVQGTWGWKRVRKAFGPVILQANGTKIFVSLSKIAIVSAHDIYVGRGH